MSKLFQYVAISLLITIIGFCVGLAVVPAEVVAIASILLGGFLIVMLIVALVMKLVKKKRETPIRFPMWVVYLFSFIEGIILYPSMVMFMEDLGVTLFLSIVVGTMLVVAALAFLGRKAKDGSFVGVGKILLVLLVVLILVSVVNLFLKVEPLNILISAGGVLIFSVYIIVDVNQFKTAYNAGLIQDERDYSIHVLNIYLDIINLLLYILDLVSSLKD